ncbi:glycoside hydrolase family 65 protein [Secundilactobacillus paracollinoides]|uniref:glycoside hydrolase family 65 protein n=2 Tax=Secundilactobacillus paracollinoides TaxID=240427 RepID=UPI0006EF1685|nr:glycosyl hydrolase family 65 protein [Secundilactobacillus paracollinoides]KRL76327.1 Kojibiose phosphorylase [Secundilactobacillus paracollinoides DSM 15502 = JCM 11969]
MDTTDEFQIHLQRLPFKKATAIETVYALGNGHFGVRASNPLQGDNPDYPGQPGLFINGFYDLTALHYGEDYPGYPQNSQTMCQLPDPRFIVLEIDGLRSDDETFSVKQVDKNLNLKTGLLSEIYEITSPTDKTVRLTMQTFASQDDARIYGVAYSLSALNFSGNVKVIKQHRYTQQQIPQHDIDVRNVQRQSQLTCTYQEADHPTMQMITRKSQLAITLQVQPLKNDDQPVPKLTTQDQLPTYVTDFDLVPGIAQEVDFVYSIGFPHPVVIANADPDTVDQTLANETFSTLLNKSAHQWAIFWDNSDVELKGDAKLAKSIRFNLFHLNQAAGRDGMTSIPAKGLTGSGYEGHYFWNAEMFMLPFFIFTQPETAKQVLSYRYSKLLQAQQRAREMTVKKGVLFPWRTINGTEASAYYPAGTAQVHINADIAYAVDLYVRVTDDQDFLATQGLPLIIETARFWLSYGHYATDDAHHGRFVINDVTGPDEYTAMVNNNYYTNRMAQHNLYLAAHYARILGQTDNNVIGKLGLTTTEIDAFQHAADQMYLPFDPNRQIKKQDDTSTEKPVWPIAETPRTQFPLLLHYHPMTIYHYQVNKQADTVMSDFLFPEDQDQAQLKRDYDYYEAITVHDSSLSRAIFGILAHRLDEADKSYQYFMDTALTDLTDAQGNVGDGIHAANMGGSWLSLIYGFAGLEIKDTTLHLHPKLPTEWLEMRFKLWFQHRHIGITINHQAVILENLKGKPITIQIGDKQVTLGSERVTVPFPI